MQPLARDARTAVAVWIVLAITLWNGLFEMIVIGAVKEYVFRVSLDDAGHRPFTPIAAVMDPAIYYATWVATLWTSIILLAALLTIRAFRRRAAV